VSAVKTLSWPPPSYNNPMTFRQFKSAPRNHPLHRKAGTQDSVFCASYESSVVVFPASPQSRRGGKPDNHRTVLVFSWYHFLLIHKGLWAASTIPFPCFGKEVEFLRRYAAVMTTAGQGL
jgi:hypothetical protein